VSSSWSFIRQLQFIYCDLLPHKYGSEHTAAEDTAISLNLFRHNDGHIREQPWSSRS